MAATGQYGTCILLEDANDLVEMAEASGRVVPLHKWSPEVAVAVRNAIDSQANEGLL